MRVIASTNREPREAIEQGLLREDLYYRLNVASLCVAPRRERRDDIEALVWHFLKTLNATLAREIPVAGVSAQAISGRPIETMGASSARLMSIPDAGRQLVIRTLEANHGNVSAAARALGISRKKLYARILRYGRSF